MSSNPGQSAGGAAPSAVGNLVALSNLQSVAEAAELMCAEELPAFGEYPPAIVPQSTMLQKKPKSSSVSNTTIPKSAWRSKPPPQPKSTLAESESLSKHQQKAKEPERKRKRKERIPVSQSPDTEINASNLSRHVMCDWSSLGLGTTAGSGAYNRALRAQAIRGGGARIDSVPQLSSAECLHRMQQILHISTILPPEGSFLMDQSRKDPPDVDAEAHKLMEDLYHEMVRQDVDDGNSFRRELRFTPADEVCQRMAKADSDVLALDCLEKELREEAESNGLLDSEMLLEMSRLRGFA